MNTTDPQREKDVLALAEAVKNMSPEYYNNLNGPDESICPLCSEKVNYQYAEMSDIKHSPDCAYLIAKDLSTNLIKS